MRDRDAQGLELERPGISVRDHCLNVGCVAQTIITALPPSVQALLPGGAVTLAALHDVGKITIGFQVKCPLRIAPSDQPPCSSGEIALSVTDHALVSQRFLQALPMFKPNRLWAVAVGAHHGRPKGRKAPTNPPEALLEWAAEHRTRLLQSLQAEFGPLPATPPDPRFEPYHSDLWLLAGLITVADWIGSNESWFSPSEGLVPDAARRHAHEALRQIGWPGGSLRTTPFNVAFGFPPNAVQQAVADGATAPRLIIVEAPMGCGKTEAALRAAQQLIAAGIHQGLYFALPTQVTSNRIHLRLARFLQATLADPAQLRLAHSNAWLEHDFNLRLAPAYSDKQKPDDTEPAEMITEARSWFASSKQALLAPYGVGTIDQALQGMVIVKHFFVRRFALAGKVVILDEIHSYDIYTGTLVSALVRELMNLGCTVIILSATLTAARRRELLAAVGSCEHATPPAYPLVTTASPGACAVHQAPVWSQSKQIALRCEPIAEDAVIAEFIARARAGQHVLWIRNTVIEAQQSFRALRDAICKGEVALGLLHSRFPFQRRAQLEGQWLEQLGPKRPVSGPGSILVATQVVEQSVDIDLDFIVSDLAPTDMVLQRMGRLWRHERPSRAAVRPEFWIRLPDLAPANDARTLKQALGRSARVYAPYVLLRSAQVWQGRSQIILPADIREVLETTYADPPAQEPPGYPELCKNLNDEKQQLAANAEAAMRVLGGPMLDPEDDRALTRRKGPPTVPVLLLRSVVQAPAREWTLTALDGTTHHASEFEWRMASARFIHRWLVLVPKWMVPANAPRPAWLALHHSSGAAAACVQPDGRLLFGDTLSTTSYHDDFGVFVENPTKTRPQPEPWSDNDDEFDS